MGRGRAAGRGACSCACAMREPDPGPGAEVRSRPGRSAVRQAAGQRGQRRPERSVQGQRRLGVAVGKGGIHHERVPVEAGDLTVLDDAMDVLEDLLFGFQKDNAA
jgi:hypothetical protein